MASNTAYAYARETVMVERKTGDLAWNPSLGLVAPLGGKAFFRRMVSWVLSQLLTAF